MNYLKENFNEIEKRIQTACDKVGRSRSEVTLIAVSKTVEADIMNASIEAGVIALGESKVQEIRRKFDDVKKGVQWHLIGHLQSNKVKYIIDKVDMIHSVDSLKLAEEISKRAVQHNKHIKVLIQVDAANEESKFGIDRKEVKHLIDEIARCPNVIVSGLMFIAPFVENSENVRKYFLDMKDIFNEIKYNSNNEKIKMEHLSMGMTNDFEVAIEEGATLLRVGTGIYGKRDYM